VRLNVKAEVGNLGNCKDVVSPFGQGRWKDLRVFETNVTCRQTRAHDLKMENGGQLSHVLINGCFGEVCGVMPSIK
jgi:hypothetical protein